MNDNWDLFDTEPGDDAEDQHLSMKIAKLLVVYEVERPARKRLKAAGGVVDTLA